VSFRCVYERQKKLSEVRTEILVHKRNVNVPSLHCVLSLCLRTAKKNSQKWERTKLVHNGAMDETSRLGLFWKMWNNKSPITFNFVGKCLLLEQLSFPERFLRVALNLQNRFSISVLFLAKSWFFTEIIGKIVDWAISKKSEILNLGICFILSGSVCFLNNVAFLKGLWELRVCKRTDFRLRSYFWRKVGLWSQNRRYFEMVQRCGFSISAYIKSWDLFHFVGKCVFVGQPRFPERSLRVAWL
jgi:hypothetical protein